MGNVFLNVFGSGYSYTDNPTPNDGERFNIYNIPDAGQELLDVRAFDSHDYSVAIPVAEHISMVYRDLWGNLYVDVYFSGSTPPPPTPGAHLPAWLLKRIADKNRGML